MYAEICLKSHILNNLWIFTDQPEIRYYWDSMEQKWCYGG